MKFATLYTRTTKQKGRNLAAGLVLLAASLLFAGSVNAQYTDLRAAMELQCSDTNQFAGAIHFLTDPKTSLLNLVKANLPATHQVNAGYQGNHAPQPESIAYAALILLSLSLLARRHSS